MPSAPAGSVIYAGLAAVSWGGDGMPRDDRPGPAGFRPAFLPKGDGRRGGGFGGSRTATRPGSAGIRQLDGSLMVDSLGASLGPSRQSGPAPSLAGTKPRRGSDAEPRRGTGARIGGRSRARAAGVTGPRAPSPRPVRPVTPVLQLVQGTHGATRGAGQAFPLPRSSWNAKLSRPSSTGSSSRRSSRVEPGGHMFISSQEWEPSHFPAEPEPEHPTSVQPTGRVYVATCSGAQRARDLAEIHAKYAGSCETTGDGMASLELGTQDGVKEEPLLCPKHLELAAKNETQNACSGASAVGSKTRSMGFLFCGDCFALQADRKQQQAEEERQREQQLASGEHCESIVGGSGGMTRQAAEMRFGKTISDRILGGDDRSVARAPSPLLSDRTRSGAMGMQQGQAGCWESADRDQPHHYNFR